jgi:hypothetical protein
LSELNSDYKGEKPTLSEFITASIRSTADKRERLIRHKVIYEKLRAALS